MILRLRDRELDLSAPGAHGHRERHARLVLRPPGAEGPGRAGRARRCGSLDDGAAIVDVGGESGRTDTEAVPVEEEIERVVPVVERLAAAGALVSVDTWRGPVARAVARGGRRA